MKIGILAYRQAPYISANTAIAYIVGRKISKTDKVVFIGRMQDDCQKSVNQYEGIKISYLNIAPKKPSLWKEKLERLGLHKLVYWQDIQTLRGIIQREALEALICVIAPNDDSHIALSVSLGIPVYLYQLDPFYNHGDIENIRLKRVFCKYIKRAKHTFTTKLLMEIYKKDTAIRPYLDKITVAQFPKLVANSKSASIGRKQSNGKAILLYAGSLYAGRNPHLLVDLYSALASNCEIVFCGKCEREEEKQMLEEAGIQCMGYCSQEKLQEELEKADFLINIGNTVRNQLPSKIIDYIATGKPIINLYQIDDCPSLAVLADYTYCLNVRTDEITNETESISTFVQKNHGKRMQWDQVLERYKEYTPEYVTRQVLSVIKSNHEGA